MVSKFFSTVVPYYLASYLTADYWFIKSCDELVVDDDDGEVSDVVLHSLAYWLASCLNLNDLLLFKSDAIPWHEGFGWLVGWLD